MRVLVTGSRTWTDKDLIRQKLLGGKQARGASYTVVHGACPQGADRMVDEITAELGLAVERHPADWKKHGNRAGFVRNAEMVATRPDFCLAFIHNSSRGATMCADLADKAGIPTYRFLEES